MRAHALKRGFTLMECVVALGLLMVGGLATAQLVTLLSNSSTKVEATTDAVALANMVLSQINDAEFFSPTQRDAGLAIGVHSTPAGTITAVGSFPQDNPTLTVSYEVVDCAACTTPFPGSPPALGGVEVIVTVDNADPHEKLVRPLRFFTRKEYAPTNTDVGLQRGW